MPSYQPAGLHTAQMLRTAGKQHKTAKVTAEASAMNTPLLRSLGWNVNVHFEVAIWFNCYTLKRGRATDI